MKLQLALIFVTSLAAVSFASTSTLKNDDFKKVTAQADTDSSEDPNAKSNDDGEVAKPEQIIITTKPAPGTEELQKADGQTGSESGAGQESGSEKIPALKDTTKSSAPTELTLEEKREEPKVKKADKVVDKPATHAKASATTEKSVPAETSLKWLTNGNVRFVKKHFRADGRLPADRAKNATSQHPHAIVLSCADSRVAPEIVFDQGIGEIFTIRVAGEALDSSVIASIEYAVEHLGPKLIVVMGHTRCGAVEAALNAKDDSAGSPDLDKLIASIKPHLKTLKTEKPSPNLEVEGALNADGVARELVQRSSLIKERVEAGDLKIKTALYWIDSGTVKFY